MAVNQSQVDHIITAASEDDPEVKLQNLEREVDLIKTSIKRLLMDIRERMNEMENPFTIVASSGGTASAGATAEGGSDAEEAKKSALEAREAALDARESEMDATQSKIEAEKSKEEAEKKKKEAAAKTDTNHAGTDEKKALDEQMLALLRSQVGVPHKPVTATSAQAAANEKLRLQKVYKLFKWTHNSVKKFGHDRLEIMLESYRVMGYISRESADEIREISRLMPANLGEEHEVGPDEFVSELYALNRILTPNDTSLDRDMIEVMMEQRHDAPTGKRMKSEDRIDLSSIPVPEKKSSSKDREKDEEWMNLPDRI
ncbi:hypothetical protein [Methanoregula formicica]|uniref:Archaeal flagella protein FlaD/E domain-containing protein n=1 Tax=Methanoregula formicica (strain DSM 22288 / NBRC 105244 / SMSP) TaxID=593750 RepID=L0HCT1_METFS|nr:hypothetical protein [Methanoregula formicica]AGB02542.1 hypothetical protein Metfor_1509 [Methanoregula formicica SMSP]